MCKWHRENSVSPESSGSGMASDGSRLGPFPPTLLSVECSLCTVECRDQDVSLTTMTFHV